MQLHNIIHGKLRAADAHRSIGPWQVPAVTDHDVGLAIKSMRAAPPLERGAVVDALRRVGQRSSWITQEELDAMARLHQIPAFHLHAIRRRINSWLSSIDDYVERVVGAVQPAGPHVRYEGGVPTTVVLAGNDFVVAPHLLGHALLAGCRLVIKPSGADPFTPFAFLRALMDEGLPAPQLLYIDSRTDEGRRQVQTLLEHTEQSLVIGEDATVAAVYGAAPLPASHKKIPHWTGRSAMLVHADADLERAAQSAVEGATFNSGRSCVSTKKVFCAAAIAGALEQHLIAEAERLRRRPYDDYYCDIGPQRDDRREAVLALAPPGDRIYDRDLVIARCRVDSPLVTDELPYPVLALVRGADDELVALANEAVRAAPSRRALNVAVFTASEPRFEQSARALCAYKIIWNGPTQPISIYDAHQGMFHFAELMRMKAICAGHPSMFEMGVPLRRPWPW